MVNIKNILAETAVKNWLELDGLQLPDCELSTESIQVIMISEVPPQNPDDGFYNTSPDSDYMKSTLGLFGRAGVDVQSIRFQALRPIRWCLNECPATYMSSG